MNYIRIDVDMQMLSASVAERMCSLLLGAAEDLHRTLGSLWRPQYPCAHFIHSHAFLFKLEPDPPIPAPQPNSFRDQV